MISFNQLLKRGRLCIVYIVNTKMCQQKKPFNAANSRGALPFLTI